MELELINYKSLKDDTTNKVSTCLKNKTECNFSVETDTLQVPSIESFWSFLSKKGQSTA